MAEMFFRHPGQVLSRQQLLSHVWGYDFEPGSNVVDVYVGYLRKKLGKELITSVRGMGYRLEPPAVCGGMHALCDPVMGDPGFEPGTSALSERRSNQLS